MSLVFFPHCRLWHGSAQPCPSLNKCWGESTEPGWWKAPSSWLLSLSSFPAAAKRHGLAEETVTQCKTSCRVHTEKSVSPSMLIGADSRLRNNPALTLYWKSRLLSAVQRLSPSETHFHGGVRQEGPTGESLGFCSENTGCVPLSLCMYTGLPVVLRFYYWKGLWDHRGSQGLNPNHT